MADWNQLATTMYPAGEFTEPAQLYEALADESIRAQIDTWMPQTSIHTSVEALITPTDIRATRKGAIRELIRKEVEYAIFLDSEGTTSSLESLVNQVSIIREQAEFQRVALAESRERMERKKLLTKLATGIRAVHESQEAALTTEG